MAKGKINKQTIEKAALAAIGVGSAVLYITNEEFRRGVRKRLNIGDAVSREAASWRRSTVGSGTPRTSASRPSDFTSLHPNMGVVYLLKAGPFYKIGRATDFRERLQRLKIQLPYPVVVIHTIPAADIHACERYWHQRFAHQRTNGEWFTLNDQEIAEFKAVTRM